MAPGRGSRVAAQVMPNHPPPNGPHWFTQAQLTADLSVEKSPDLDYRRLLWADQISTSSSDRFAGTKLFTAAR